MVIRLGWRFGFTTRSRSAASPVSSGGSDALDPCWDPWLLVACPCSWFWFQEGEEGIQPENPAPLFCFALQYLLSDLDNKYFDWTCIYPLWHLCISLYVLSSCASSEWQLNQIHYHICNICAYLQELEHDWSDILAQIYNHLDHWRSFCRVCNFYGCLGCVSWKHYFQEIFFTAIVFLSDLPRTSKQHMFIKITATICLVATIITQKTSLNLHFISPSRRWQ